MLSARIAILGIALLMTTFAIGQESTDLAEIRRNFESLKHPTEANRVKYITRLVRSRESFTRAQADMMFAIDAEVIKHPMRADVDAVKLRERLLGQWTSPRHSYLYRTDGTWTMLPEVIDGQKSTHGVWRIEGNKFFQRATVESAESDTGETIIILTDTDFVWSTHRPYYMRRGDVYPWR
jgi:hypothetical protein